MYFKGKAIPVTGHEGPYGGKTSRLPHFLENRLKDCGEVVSLTRRGSPLPPGRFLVLISVRGWVDLRAIVRLEGLGQLKNPTTTSGIEPASTNYPTACPLDFCGTLTNFRFVLQHLKYVGQYVYAHSYLVVKIAFGSSVYSFGVHFSASLFFAVRSEKHNSIPHEGKSPVSCSYREPSPCLLSILSLSLSLCCLTLGYSFNSDAIIGLEVLRLVQP
jgi:hypothetical protein